MAQLSSPGVSVTVIDESFYTPAAPGTVPLIIVASQENKMNSAGTGIAPGTLKANAGKVYLLTSQMDLGTTFGIPYFQTDASNNPVNAGELNEYGLQAAYSLLGVSNRAYVVRADLDTNQLVATATAPTGEPADGTLWFDTTDTAYGVFEWDSGAQAFVVQSVTVINDVNLLSNGTGSAPAASVGALGDYAIVTGTTLNKLWFKKYKTNTDAGTWVEVGSEDWIASWPTVFGSGTPTLAGTETATINTHDVSGATSVDGLVTVINSNSALTSLGIKAANINGLQIYSTGVEVQLTGTVWALVGALPNGSTAGNFAAPELAIAPHYQVPLFKSTDPMPAPSGSIWVKTTSVNQGADWIINEYNAATATWIEQPVKLFATNQGALAALDPTGGGINLPTGTVYVKYNDDEGDMPLADFKIYTRAHSGVTSITSKPILAITFGTGTYTFSVAESGIGSATLSGPNNVTFMTTGNAITDAQAFVTALQAVATADQITFLSVKLNTASNTITITHTAGGDIVFVDVSGTPIENAFVTNGTPISADLYANPNNVSGSWLATTWTPGTAIQPSAEPLTTIPADQTLWYNNVIDEVDIMINDGTKWCGYLNGGIPALGGGTPLNPAGPIVSATQPSTTGRANGDIWVDTSDFDNYPHIYKFNYATLKWVLVDNTDHTTENGIIFHDARWTVDGTGSAPSSIADLMNSNFVDFDAPDPALYPKGMLLWNLRRSGNNVLRYVQNYVDTTQHNPRFENELMTEYYPNRWVSDAANDVHGVGAFGRKAQRTVVLQAIEALIESNQQIRDEDSRQFNLLSCPGYLETLSSLIDLNTSRGQTAFIVADSPARLTPDATTLSNWGNNVNQAAVDGEVGLIATDAYSAVYYPWGYTTDLLGNDIVVPPSHIMLRTIALSDNVSYPWFAPAGVRRGGVTNASSVGYVDEATGEFVTTALNTGQRDTLASINVNPITYIAGTGLVAYGQKTRQLVASSLDRINVARLVIYLRYQLNAIAKPFIFEPNDTITRNEIKQQIEKLLLELTGQRALYDYIVVCDTSNNTPARIDANELYVDIAIEPVKAVEFIYIPLRLENTGAIKGLGK